MRVDERNFAGQAASNTNQAAEPQRIQVTTGSAGAPAGAADGDQVELSNLAGRISRAVETLANHASQRVSRLHQEYQAGRYQPDAHQISQAMLAGWPSAAEG